MTGDLSFVTNEAGIAHPALELEDELSDNAISFSLDFHNWE